MENYSLLMENKDNSYGIDNGFKKYLIAQRKRNIKGILIYAKKYGHVLHTLDASELLTISDSKKNHAMEALAALSKYKGCYDQWKQVKERYQLKWTGKDGLDVFMSIVDKEKNYPAMVAWLKSVCQSIPLDYGNILLFATLVGLRPNEACQSISLIHNDLDNYLKKESMILEHWKYQELFIRNSKKAFISIINENIISLAQEANNCGYDALRNYVKRRKLDMHMGYCRKIFGTYLRIKGVESEIIDLLQGRIPKSVFARHYYRPDFQQSCNRIRDLLRSLYKEIIV